MADMGNMLAEYGADPSILEQVDRRRADRTVNQLNEAKLYMAGDEMNRANQLRGAYGRLQAGDKSADAEIAGLDPAFHQTMKTNIAALNESNRKILEEESDKVGRIMVASMNDPKLWASNGLGIPWEQRQQALMKVMASKDVFEAYRKGNEYTNAKMDDSGQFIGIRNGQAEVIPGAKGYVAPKKWQTQGSGTGKKKYELKTYTDPETLEEKQVLFDPATGDIKPVNGLTQPAPAAPEGDDPLKAYMDAQRAAGGQKQPANSLATPEPAPAPSNALAEPAVESPPEAELNTARPSTNPERQAAVTQELASIRAAMAAISKASMESKKPPNKQQQKLIQELSAKQRKLLAELNSL